MGFDTKVNWDEGAFKDAANQGLKKMSSQLQEVCDSVLSTHGGSSEEEVRAALRSALLALDLNPDAADEFVAAIASGQRVVVKPKGI
jgi:signal recognition particle GTPase